MTTDVDVTLPRARALVPLPDGTTGRPDAQESARLAATFGTVLRGLREERGMSALDLASRSMVTQRMIRMLEAGQRRPRPALLGALAYGLAPEDPRPVHDLLIAAAGPSLREDTPPSLRRRRRRMRAGIRAGVVELPPSVRERLEAHAAADDAFAAAMASVRRAASGPQARDSVRLLGEARRLRELAGPPVAVEAGATRTVHGWRFP